MVNKIRVYGKAQNRTVQGIFNAYLIMYPHATLNDLNKAFPKELHHGNNPIFVDTKEAAKYTKVISKGERKGEEDNNFDFLFFTDEKDIFRLQDGTKAVMLQMWIEDWYKNVEAHAKQYGIEVASIEYNKPFGKGEYRLEYLNGYVPPSSEKKKTKWWLWLLLLLLLIGIILFFLFGRKNPEPVIIEKIVEKEVIVEKIIKDTVYIQQLAEIEKDFNAAKFIAGKADLSDDAKFVLHDLAKLLNSNPDLKLKIVGHTSKEGTEDFNKKLSEARAKAAVDFLVNDRQVDISRLVYEGVGSSQPLDESQLEINRRTEFIVME